MEFYNLNQARKSLHSHVFRGIHQKAVQASEELKTKEIELIKVLQEVEDKLVHRYVGYNSLFTYAHKALRLSRAQSYMYCALAKKTKICPLFYKSLQEGEVSPSKASRILSVITPENEKHWVNLAKDKSKKELEKEIARVSPKAIKPDRAKYIDNKTLELSLCLSEEIYEQLKRAQDLICQSEKKGADFEGVFKELVQFYLKRKDPVERAKRSEQKQRILPGQNLPVKIAKSNERKQEDLPGQNLSKQTESIKTRYSLRAKVKGQRSPLSSFLKHQVYMRDLGKCQYLHPNGEPCHEGRWVELHHIKPISSGGTHALNNLVTLCSGHHKSVHETSNFHGKMELLI